MFSVGVVFHAAELQDCLQRNIAPGSGDKTTFLTPTLPRISLADAALAWLQTVGSASSWFC
jgi:hypothetical protein